MRDSDFEYPDSLPHEPMVKTLQSPHDVVGQFIPLLKKHLQKADKLKGCSSEDFEKAMGGGTASFTQSERATIAQIYEDLRKHGYYPLGTDGLGRIRLGVATNPMAHLFRNLDPVPVKITLEMIREFNAKIEHGMLHGVRKTAEDVVEMKSERAAA